MNPSRAQQPKSSILIPGVRKAGTTFLYSVLSQHPEISAPTRKEPQFFACDPDTVRTHLSWYLEFMRSQSTQSLLDASTWYFMAPDAPRLIRDSLRRPKLLLCLRDPVDRAYSAYLHQAKQEPPADRRTFKQVIEAIESSMSGGLTLFEAEAAAVDLAARRGLLRVPACPPDFHARSMGAPFSTNVASPNSPYLYFTESSYSTWYPYWADTFSYDLRVVCFETLVDRTEDIFTDLCSFLDLDPFRAPPLKPRQNSTAVPRGPASRLVIRFQRYAMVGALLSDSVRSSPFVAFLRRLKTALLFRTKPPLHPNLRSRAAALLSKEYSFWNFREPYPPWIIPSYGHTSPSHRL